MVALPRAPVQSPPRDLPLAACCCLEQLAIEEGFDKGHKAGHEEGRKEG